MSARRARELVGANHRVIRYEPTRPDDGALQQRPGLTGFPRVGGRNGQEGAPLCPDARASVIPADLLDQLLAGGDAAAALQQGSLLDSLKKSALKAEMDHHLGR